MFKIRLKDESFFFLLIIIWKSVLNHIKLFINYMVLIEDLYFRNTKIKQIEVLFPYPGTKANDKC